MLSPGASGAKEIDANIKCMLLIVPSIAKSYVSISQLRLPPQSTKEWVASMTDIDFLTVLEAANLRSGCQHGQVLGKAVFLALCVRDRERDRKISSSSDKPMVLLDMGPHPHDLTNLNYILKILYPDVVTLELQHTNFGSTQFSPLHYALIQDP